MRSPHDLYLLGTLLVLPTLPRDDPWPTLFLFFLGAACGRAVALSRDLRRGP